MQLMSAAEVTVNANQVLATCLQLTGSCSECHSFDRFLQWQCRYWRWQVHTVTVSVFIDRFVQWQCRCWRWQVHTVTVSVLTLTGSYSDSVGIDVARRDIAAYITQRDGGIFSDHNDVFLSTGASDGIKASLLFVIIFQCFGGLASMTRLITQSLSLRSHIRRFVPSCDSFKIATKWQLILTIVEYPRSSWKQIGFRNVSGMKFSTSNFAESWFHKNLRNCLLSVFVDVCVLVFPSLS